MPKIKTAFRIEMLFRNIIAILSMLISNNTVKASHYHAMPEDPVSLRYQVITKSQQKKFSLNPFDIFAKQILSRQETPWSTKYPDETKEWIQLERATKNYQLGKIDANTYHSVLINLWNQTFLKSTPEYWLIQAEIADKIDYLHELFSDLPLIQLDHHPEFRVPSSDHNLKYVAFDKLEDSLKYLNDGMNEFQWEQSLIQNHLIYYEPYYISETIQKIYGSESSIYKFFGGDRTTKALTKQIGFHSRLEKSADSVIMSIAEFSTHSGITPWVLENSENGSHLQVRGIRWNFGRSVNEFRSLNDWFLRKISPKAKKQLLSERNSEIFSSGVIAGAQSKIRIETFAPGQLNQSQTIVGKVLNRESLLKAEQSGDLPSYYRNKYQFKVSDLLSINPGKLSANKILKTSRFHPGSPGPSEIGIIRQSALNLIFNELNQSHTIQIVQRLSPSDIHHFFNPANGKILSHKQILNLFRSRLSDRNQLSGSQKKQLDLLLHAAKTEEERLGRESINYIQISGGYDSVGAEAVKLRPSILAENQRKVLVMDHSDGNFSVHVFIGATGVSNIRLDPEPKHFESGQSLGLMGTGLNYSKGFYQNMKFYFEAKTGSDQDGQKELSPGKYLGFFPANGSTIISYYLLNYFKPVKHLQQFMESTKDFLERPEIKVHMGDLLLTRTELNHPEHSNPEPVSMGKDL